MYDRIVYDMIIIMCARVRVRVREHIEYMYTSQHKLYIRPSKKKKIA